MVKLKIRKSFLLTIKLCLKKENNKTCFQKGKKKKERERTIKPVSRKEKKKKKRENNKTYPATCPSVYHARQESINVKFNEFIHFCVLIVGILRS